MACWLFGPSSAEADAFALSSLDAISPYSRTVEKLCKEGAGLEERRVLGSIVDGHNMV